MSKSVSQNSNSSGTSQHPPNGGSGDGQDSITFSLRGNHGDLIASLYHLAKGLNVAVTSVFRHNLSMYADILDTAEKGLSKAERPKFDDVVKVIGLSHLARVEDKPSRDSLVDYVKMAGKESLASFVENSSDIRLMLIVDRARAHAGRIEMARLKIKSAGEKTT